jgi:hypothetical protein
MTADRNGKYISIVLRYFPKNVVGICEFSLFVEIVLANPAHAVHADVPAGLKQLKDAGFRLVTCTNSPPDPHTQASMVGLKRRSASIAFAASNLLRKCTTWSPKN